MPSIGYKLNLWTAISIVISSMIGTGIFTSLGLQVSGLPSVFAILVLWTIGGIVAICGALNYGELAAAFPRSGGEYNYLSILLHPMVGFLSAFVSAIVGFAAPAALSSMAFAIYFEAISGIHAPVIIACVVLVLFTFLHSFHLKLSSLLQNISTGINLLLILLFIVAGFIKGAHNQFSVSVDKQQIQMLFSQPFAVSLIYVYFAYTGWNSAIYIAGEISKPKRNLSLSLLLASAIVMILYILLNFIFLYVVPINQLKDKIDIGYITAAVIFGALGGKIISLIICVSLAASVSSYLFFGPRVLSVLGEDFPLLKKLNIKNKYDIPVIALFFLSFIALILILTSSFDAILSITSIVLSLFTSLTVACIFSLRWGSNTGIHDFKAFGFPYTALFFLFIEFWMMYYTLKVKTKDSLYGFSFLIAGCILYYFIKKKSGYNIKVTNQ